MNITIKILLIAFLVLSEMYGYAQMDNATNKGILIITNDTVESYDLDPFTLFLPDIDETYTIDDFLTNDSLINFPTEINNQGFIVKREENKSAIQWMQFEIENHTNKSIEWFLDFERADEIYAYEILDTNEYTLHKNGALIKGSERDVKHKRRYWIKFITGKKSTTRFVIKLINTHDNLNPSARIVQTRPFYERYRIERYIEGVFPGIMLIIIITNLILFFSTWDRTYLYYVSYVFWFTLLFLGIENIIFEMFFSEWPHLFNNSTTYVAGGLTLCAYLLFVNKYLNLKSESFRWYTILTVVSIMSLLVIVIMAVMQYYGYDSSKGVLSFWSIIVFALVNIPAIIFIRKGHQPAKLLLMGNAALTIGIFTGIFFQFDISNHFTNHLIEISFVTQVIIFSKGIGDRITIERKEKQNAQKKALEVLEEKVQERTVEVVKQKEVIEETHKEITDSINYAKRLQDAILPSFDEVTKHLPNNFILFKPKDVVSGDFYWFEQMNGYSYLAAADCTGHGVPGAMVSVVCSNALNRSVNEFGITEPSKILDKTRELVIETFAKSGEGVKDGMDIALCAFKDNKVIYSGANNPLWIVRKTELLTQGQKEERSTIIDNGLSIIEHKANKQPIGLYAGMKDFTQEEIDLHPGDSLYFFTDGFADQFGGEKGKKFKYKPFKRFLIDLHTKPINERAKLISDSFENWRGELEQIDDVCVIGVKIE